MMRVLLRDTETGGYFNRPEVDSLSITADEFEVHTDDDDDPETFSRDRHVLLSPTLNPQGDGQ